MSGAIRIRTALVAAILAMAASTALAQDHKVVEVGKVFPYLERFLKVPAPNRTRLTLAYALRRDGKPVTDLRVALVEAGGARTPLPIGPGGVFERNPTLAQLTTKAKVTFDVPASVKLGTVMIIAPTLKPAADYEVRDLAATVAEANAVIGKAAGPAALLAPKMAGVGFPGAGTGEAVFADGRKQPLPVVQDMPFFRPDDFEGAVRVRLAKPPSRTAFYLKKK